MEFATTDREDADERLAAATRAQFENRGRETDGTVRLETRNRGEALFRWVDRFKGKGPLAVVDDEEGGG